MRYRKEIDGLRAVAVLPVILFHAGMEFFSGGYVGVDVFFVISGYLITTIILAEKSERRFTLANFYERRARRILPALFVVMFVCMPLAWHWMTPRELNDFAESITGVALFYSNIFFWLESGYFDTAAELKPLLHTWSLAVEEQYYLLFPLFITLTWRFGKQAMFTALALIGFASLGLAHWNAVDYPSATFYLLPTRLWELLIGSLVAFYLLDHERGHGTRQQILSACGLVMILFAIFVFDERTPFPSLYALIPTVGTALIILFASEKTATGAFLCNRLLVGVGLISYSAYLWHQPLFAFGRLATVGEPSTQLMAALGILALFLAYLTWRFVEQPFRNKQRFDREVIFKGALAITVALSLAGFTGQYKNGDLDRYSAQQLQVLADIERLKEERRVLNRAEVCHFTEKNEDGLEYFLENWNCWDEDADAGLRKIPVIVVGDSHAADIVIALRTNGYEPLQIGGTGCSLNPDYMTETCKRIFDKLSAVASGNTDFNYLVLANRFSKNELSMESIAKTIDYWEQYNLSIAIFTGMPRFAQFEQTVLRSEPPRPDLEIADYSARDEIVHYLTQRGVHVINRKELFCSIAAGCNYRDENDELLLVDHDHFSREGARRFGARLLESDLLFGALTK